MLDIQHIDLILWVRTKVRRFLNRGQSIRGCVRSEKARRFTAASLESDETTEMMFVVIKVSYSIR
jgi:hypothetical protein